MTGELSRQAKRYKTGIKEAELPFLWILTPTCSARILESFAATLDELNWERGVYLLPNSQRAALVVIHQLSVTRQTLWLRVLGKGSTQKQAIAELMALPPTHPLRSDLLEILANWRKKLEWNLTPNELQ
jgi:hypothetical protein